VGFHGEGSGIGALTWGQQEIWNTIQRTGRTLNIGGVMRLPEGRQLKEFESLLRFVITRHQALRTRLKLDATAPPQQIVESSGEICLQVLDIDADDDPDTAAERLRGSYEDKPFDYAHEWPVRMGVVRQAGELTHLVVQYCHLAVDGQGIQAIVRDLANMDDATATVQGIRPLELAQMQASPLGRHHSEKSLRYWENLLRGIPAQRSGGSTDHREPRFWELFCYSPAMHLALRAIAARTKVDTSHVLLAAYAVAVARITGRNPSVAQVIVSNRFRPRFAPAVAALSQPSLCVIDTAGAGFDEVVGRAWRASTAGNLHAYYDPRQHREMMARLARERGEDIDISCFVNDRRDQPPPRPDDPLPTRGEILTALERTTLRWDRRQATFDGRFYLQVDSAPDTNVPGRINPREAQLPAVYLAIWADTHFLAPQDIEAVARKLESQLVQAA